MKKFAIYLSIIVVLHGVLLLWINVKEDSLWLEAVDVVVCYFICGLHKQSIKTLTMHTEQKEKGTF